MIPRVFIRRVRTRSTADFAQTDPSFASRKVNPPKPGPSRFPDKPRPYPPRRFERRRFSAYRFETRRIELSPTFLLVVGVILACRPASTTHSRARAASLPDSEAFTRCSSRPLSATPPIATRLHGPTARPLSSRRSSRKRHDRLLVVLDRDGFPNHNKTLRSRMAEPNRLACKDRASWNGSRLSAATPQQLDPADLEQSFQQHLRNGIQFLDDQDYGRAITEFEHALRIGPKHAEARRLLGRALMEWGDLQRARIELTEAVRLRPGVAEAHFDLGVLLAVKLRQLDDGLKEFEEALRLQPLMAEAHFNAGLVYWYRGDDQRSIERFRRAVEIRHDYVEARRRLGQALTRAGRTEEAASELSRAVQLQPDDATNHLQLSVALRKLGRTTEANAALQKYSKLRDDRADSVKNDQAGMTSRMGLTALGKGIWTRRKGCSGSRWQRGPITRAAGTH